MNTTATQVQSDYRKGRNTYHLLASDAFAYARQRAALRRTDEFYVDAEVDTDADDPTNPGLVVMLIDFETDVILDCLGGVDLDYQVSDHGNVHVDLDHPHITAMVWDMASDAGLVGV